MSFVRSLGKGDFPAPGIWFWSNVLMLWSRLFGVPKTIRVIRWLASRLLLNGGSLQHFSCRIDELFKRRPHFLLFRKQRCLHRGFLLFFYGKRMRREVALRFGCRLEEGNLHSHCWLMEKGNVLFEVGEVISHYETFVEYT